MVVGIPYVGIPYVGIPCVGIPWVNQKDYHLVLKIEALNINAL